MENKVTKVSPAKLKANKKWNSSNYEQINVAVPKGTKLLWRNQARKVGYTSLNAFIKDAINEKIERG